MDVTATIRGVNKIRDRHVIVIMFSEPNCPFEDSPANFYDPTDSKLEHMVVFEEGYWTRTGTRAYHIHPSKLYGLSASSSVQYGPHYDV